MLPQQPFCSQQTEFFFQKVAVKQSDGSGQAHARFCSFGLQKLQCQLIMCSKIYKMGKYLFASGWYNSKNIGYEVTVRH